MCKCSGPREVTFVPKECKEDQGGWNREKGRCVQRICRNGLTGARSNRISSARVRHLVFVFRGRERKKTLGMCVHVW